MEKVLKLKPDLLTLDINMPVMDGLQALEVIMKDCPVPVVMCSSLTKEGADATIKALSLGAVDFINKTGGSVSRIDTIETEIISKCRAAAGVRVSRLNAPFPPVAKPPSGPPAVHRINMPPRWTAHLPPLSEEPFHEHPKLTIHSIPKEEPRVNHNKLVVIGTSTGGPKALQTVIAGLPGNLPCGVLVVQHMPPGFTKSLAERLDEISQISVKEAGNRDIIERGHVYIAPGNYHMTVALGAKGREIILNQDPPIGTLRPAADVLFNSVASLGKDIVSVILTGMGADGAAGMKAIKGHGGYVIAEAEETCVVYGMPKAVIDQGLADEVRALPEIAGAIVNAVYH